MKHWSKVLSSSILLLLTACATTPTVRVVHAPFHPSATDNVTFTADAHAEDGVSVIDIVQRSFDRAGFCAAYVAGRCVPLAMPTVKTVKSCRFEPVQADARCEAIVPPFGDGSFVTYGASVKDARGTTAEDEWIGFAVGTQADATAPVAVYTRGNDASALDVVLIPVDYNGVPGRTYRDFVGDVRRLVVEGYLAHEQVTNNRDKWNFYVNPVTGGLMQTTIGSTVNRSVTQPTNWSKVSAFADVAGYVHNNASWRDFASFGGGGVGSFTIQAPLTGTILHETGHAIFGLSDEYCCDGGIVTTSWQHENMFSSQASCQASAGAHGVTASDCTQLTATNGFCGGRDASGNPILGGTNQQWRQDAASDLMGCGGNSGADAGLLDDSRIHWLYDSL